MILTERAMIVNFVQSYQFGAFPHLTFNSEIADELNIFSISDDDKENEDNYSHRILTLP